jgi:hypothetical protein
MKFLTQYPLIRYVVEVMFVLSAFGFLVSLMVSSWSGYAGRVSSASRRTRWKRPEEMGRGCWKVTK